MVPMENPKMLLVRSSFRYQRRILGCVVVLDQQFGPWRHQLKQYQ